MMLWGQSFLLSEQANSCLGRDWRWRANCLINTFVFYPNARFRGDRDYYHSTDCYTHLLEGIKTHTSFCCEGPIHVNFSRPLSSMPRFTVSKTGESPTQSNNHAIDFSLLVSKEKVCGWVEPTDKPITLRQPYCENFVSDANLHENKIFFRYSDLRVSAIELTTALAMELLRRSALKIRIAGGFDKVDASSASEFVRCSLQHLRAFTHFGLLSPSDTMQISL